MRRHVHVITLETEVCWMKPDECDRSLCLYCCSTTGMMLQPLEICYHQLQPTTVILFCWQQPLSLDHNWYMIESCWHFTQYFLVQLRFVEDTLNYINCVNYQCRFWWSFGVGRRSSPFVCLFVCLSVLKVAIFELLNPLSIYITFTAIAQGRTQ